MMPQGPERTASASIIPPVTERRTARGAAYERARSALDAPSDAPRIAPRAIIATDDRGAAMRRFVEIAWRELASTGVSWLGFYIEARSSDGRGHLALAAREPKPACSPIGLHGACGQCLRTARPLVVRDIAELGAEYVACDPRDRSEVVVPCLPPVGPPWGVLDLDSHEIGAFDEEDIDALVALLRSAGLSR